MAESKSRDNYIDILRGIGILSVVIGHAFNTDHYFETGMDNVRKFVYIYHLAIFFWCSGYLFKLKKPNAFAKSIFKNLYIRSAIISLLSLLLIPVWYKLNVTAPVNSNWIIDRVLMILRFNAGAGLFTGALWFVTWFAVAQIIFYVLMSATERLKRKEIQIAVFLAAGGAGILTVHNGILGNYFFNKALLIQPVLLFGLLCRKYCPDFRNRIKGWWFPFLGVMILLLDRVTGKEIELSKSLIYGGAGFYPMIILGILFCLSLANVIANTKLSFCFAYLGKKSFLIMALHFMAFKTLDAFVGIAAMGKIPPEQLHMFPISFSGLGARFSYILVGVFLPLLFDKGTTFLWNHLKTLHKRY